VLAGLRHLGVSLRDQRIVLLGAGAAGIGIARLLRAAMREEGMSRRSIERAVVLLDSRGLVHDARGDVEDDKQPFAMSEVGLRDLGLANVADRSLDLAAVVAAVRPTVLIGTTGVPGAFTEAAVRSMADGCRHPIVLPLSNPTALAEARPIDILSWTEGRALVASGSPFPAVETQWGRREIGQANNVYIFPGVGLGAIVAEATELDERTFLRAARRLSELVSEERLAAGGLYPPVSELRLVARAIAAEVVRQARDTEVGRQIPDDRVDAEVAAAMWHPEYLPFEPA
jgi:malic enzyme